MKNIPRIFIDEKLSAGIQIPLPRETMHYLTRVMRTDKCLAFGNGVEYNAHISDDQKFLVIDSKTNHTDPSGNLTLMFAPIKRTDDLINMATQMGVAVLQPVITDRTNATHINWERMKKIATEAAEQSNRNSVPKIMPPVKFSDLDLSKIIYADERVAYGKSAPNKIISNHILVGPEGGFSDSEFNALDAAGACGISLGKTILRAEVAAVVAITKVIE